MSDLQRTVGKFFLRLGCPNKYDGYRYMLDGVCIAVQSDTGMMCLRKSVYKELSRKYGTDTRNIERCIRHLICRWWFTCQCGCLFNRRPTNSELICHLAECVRLDTDILGVEELSL